MQHDEVYLYPTVAFFFFSRTDSTDSPDSLPGSVFYFYFFPLFSF